MKKTLSPGWRYGGVFLALFLISQLATGCSKPKGTISGKVTYQGKALPGGFVIFLPEKGPAVNATIDSEGKYRADNVPVGTARISVQAHGAPDPESQNQAPPKPRSPADMKQFLMPKTSTVFIPPQYNDPEKSGLTCDVKQGPQEHDIPLK
jgi:hypothetical protein